MADRKKEPQEVEATVVKDRSTRADVEATRGETFVTPDVDIYRTDDALVLVADVPGVAAGGVDLGLENGVLEITAHRRTDEPKEPDYEEFRPRSYYRAFALSDEVDAGKIEAKLADGVLTVTLPKSPEARPRKIKVEAG